MMAHDDGEPLFEFCKHSLRSSDLSDIKWDKLRSGALAKAVEMNNALADFPGALHKKNFCRHVGNTPHARGRGGTDFGTGGEDAQGLFDDVEQLAGQKRLLQYAQRPRRLGMAEC